MKKLLGAWIILGGLAGAVQAELADPTRPPGGAVAQSEAGAVGEFRLQSVVLPQNGRPVAVIGGQTVPLGGQVGDARLVRLSERMAVLEGPEGVTRLYLTPGVDIQAVKPASRRRPAGPGDRVGGGNKE